MTNGDFSFDADGVDRNGAAVSLGLINGPPVLIQAWTAAGGGALTYARWGGAVSQNTAYDWAGVAGVAGANRSMVYFGACDVCPYYTTEFFPTESDLSSHLTSQAMLVNGVTRM